MKASGSTSVASNLPGIDGLFALYPPLTVTVIGPESLFRSGFTRHISSHKVNHIDTDPTDENETVMAASDSHAFQKNKIIVSANGGVKKFYRASLERESGLIEPEKLSGLWQNIATVETFDVETISLEAALFRTGHQSGWLVFEQLGAANILAASENVLDSVDVIVTRTAILQTSTPKDDSLTASAVERVLAPRGFIAISKYPAKSPRSAYSVFVRDWKTASRQQLSSLQETTASLEKQLIESKAECQAASEALSAAQESVADHTEALKTDLTRARDELESIKGDLSEAQAHSAKAEKREKIAKNNLSELEKKYRTLAKKQLSDEQKMMELQEHLSIVLNEITAEKNSQQSDSGTGRRKSPARKRADDKNA